MYTIGSGNNDFTEQYFFITLRATDIINLMDTIGDSDFEYNPIDMTNAVPFGELRADHITEFDNMDGIVKNGPQVIANQFVVPKIVD